MAAEEQLSELKLDPEALYQEEVFTDRRIGSILRLTPVTPEGEPDSDRQVIYVGQTQLMTPAGALPLNFEISAGSLKEAAEKFAEGAQKAAEEMMERLQEMRREAASSIVTPGSGGFGGPGGPGGPAGPGGGIQLR